MANESTDNKKPSRIARLTRWSMDTWRYCSQDVWNDNTKSLKVNLIKTVNLSIRSFLNQDLQSKSCALTYRTLLAIVPALALLFAIGRGFGLQDTLQSELIKYFPSQQTMLQQAFHFVDSYLNEASGGVFVGIGIVFLLWTLISLLSSVESSFNTIWQVHKGRQLWRKVTDYLAIFIMLPVLMICAAGLQLMMTTSLKTLLPYEFIDSALQIILDILSVVLTWLFFAGSYMLIPNTKVKPLPALVSGVFVGTAYQILQWLFVSGQMYVAKYNAIYGSFSFLPLFLIWLQLVWLITLIGGVMCYASQNISEFDFGDKVKNISIDYRMQVTLVVMAIIAKRFVEARQKISVIELSREYGIPINMVKPIINQLNRAGLVNYIQSSENNLTTHPLQPAIEVANLTVGEVFEKVYEQGDSDFIPDFSSRNSSIVEKSKDIKNCIYKNSGTLLIDMIND